MPRLSEPIPSCLALLCLVVAVGTPAAALEVRDLSQANLPNFGIAHADDEAITTATDAEVLAWLQGCSVKGFKDMAGYGQSDWVYRTGGIQTGSKIDAFESSWPSRALVAYMRARPAARAGQRDSIDHWFLENASFLAEHMGSFLELNFPRRDSGDYTTRQRDATKPGFYGKVTVQGGDSIPGLSQWYNNRRSICHFHLLLAAVAFRNTHPDSSRKFQDLVRRYIQEWVTYSVFPTGESGEWARNHEYPNAAGEFIEAQGLSYGAYNSGLALTAALLFQTKLADSSLRVFSTRGGLWGTECDPAEPEKSIWTASDLHLRLLAGKTTRTNGWGAPLQVLYNYTSDTAPLRAELLHPSWFLPAHRAFRPAKDGQGKFQDSLSQDLEDWLAARKEGVRADDPFGRWRGMSGISKDVRVEDFAGIAPFAVTGALRSLSPKKAPKIHVSGGAVRVDADGYHQVEVRSLAGRLVLIDPISAGKWAGSLGQGCWLVRLQGDETSRVFPVAIP